MEPCWEVKMKLMYLYYWKQKETVYVIDRKYYFFSEFTERLIKLKGNLLFYFKSKDEVTRQPAHILNCLAEEEGNRLLCKVCAILTSDKNKSPTQQQRYCETNLVERSCAFDPKSELLCLEIYVSGPFNSSFFQCRFIPR